MDRIIMHWTAGPYQPTGLDAQHYHYVIAGDGTLHAGRFPVITNRGPLIPGHYAAHTLNCNSGSIGVAMAAMAGAVAHPFDPGKYPITFAQLDALAVLCQRLAQDYAIPIVPERVLTHAEVQPVLGIAQRGKWDVTWLPGMREPGTPRTVGDQLRARIRAAAPDPVPQPPWLAQWRARWLPRLNPRRWSMT